MIPGIDQHEEIRLAMVGSNPDAVDSHPGCSVSYVARVTVALRILENIDDGLVRFRRKNGMLLLVDLHIELGPARAATGSRTSRLVLRKGYACEQKHRENGFHCASCPMCVGHGKPNGARVQMIPLRNCHGQRSIAREKSEAVIASPDFITGESLQAAIS